MSKRFRALGVGMVAVLVMLVAASPASAVSFSPAPGTYTVDTTALTLTGSGTSIAGSDQGGIAVFSFDSVNIPAGVLLEVEGSRPLKLVASGELAIGGVIQASGFSAEGFNAGPFAGGPGGGAGGIDGTDPGDGPGGGGVSPSNENGGGGGGFGGAGARGGVEEGDLDPPGLGGPAYGDLNAALQGGSGGGGGSTVGGGGGGGAIALFGSTVRILPGAEVLADGGDGAIGGNGASGGGSGGGIVLHGDNVAMDGLLSAAGGNGGEGGCCGDGGGGGGGRIALQYRALSMGGATDVTGGISGFGGGEPSIEPTGASGVVTKVAAATAATSAASALKSTSAILNGVVNPNLSATTFRFEYGTTTAYGSQTPAAAVGSDSSNHPVAQIIGGLKPNTTYHFRVVATDGIGFVTAGADMAFKTPACIVPKLKGKKVKAARKALRKANCKVGKVKRSFSSKFKKGRVMKQRPKPGKVLAAGAKVRIKVSKGEKNN
ncbi:MAG TPA: PASTA domain-containing protein [Solirubrobacterales bacterium]|nr:PASTA domain-containing protein [Solirubrobacterales bacterium]